MSSLITLQNISKVYGSGNTEVKALWDVNLSINKGDYCSIMGPSGSGKSTAMNVIGCLDRPTHGHYFFDDQDVALLNDDTLAAIRNRKIGFVFQQFHLLPQLSALDNVALPMVYGGIPTAERRQRAANALQQVGLGNRLTNKPSQLSGGQQQRVAIARAIVNRPLLLLADEPTGALDTTTTEEVMKIFDELNRGGITVVMVTHEPAVAKLTKRIVWFRDGEVVNAHMSPDNIGYGTLVE
ncbi:MAG: ABC transporter ATP-binding protein [Leptolyngbyaceae cyanobacterium MAG.088]|nr:ABC transporter ATP-binding protein [Leptolyngbyaceae cyanobacterium MAG.088]